MMTFPHRPAGLLAAAASLALLAGCQRQAPAVDASAGASTPSPAGAAEHAAPAVPAYVPNQKSGSISVIDTGTDKVVRTLSAGGELGKRLQQIALGPEGKTLYVVDAEHHRLLLVDIAGDKVERELDIGEGAEGVGLSPDGKQVAVCVEQQNQVMFVDTASFTVKGHVDVQGKAPEHCAWTPDGTQVITSNEASDSLDVIDVAAGKSIASIATSGHPRDIAFASDGHTAYVAQESADVVDVIDLVARRKTRSVTAGLRTAGVTVSSDGSRVYASNGGGASVTVSDGATGKLLAEIPVGQRPWNPSLTPDGRKLYVANGRSNSVSVIDTASMKEIGQIAVGEMPWGVVMGR